MTGGLTWLRWAVATQWWHRVRRIADSPSRIVGLPEPGHAPSASDVETALGEDNPLTVVVGDRGEDVARSVHHALRLMLGDFDIVRLVEPHAVDLPEVLTLARRRTRRPLVLLGDDAPPALLDQLDAATRQLLDAQLRLVVLARRTFVDADPPDVARAVLDSAAVAFLPASAPPALVPPTESLHRAVLDTVIDWDRLGLGPALTPALVARLVTAHLPSGQRPPDLKAARRALRSCRRGGHLRKTRRRGEVHFAPTRAWLVAVDDDGPLGRPVPEAFGRTVSDVVSTTDRPLAGRVALARREWQVALWLLVGLPPDAVPPRAAEVAGAALAARADAEDERVRARWRGGDPEGPTALRKLAVQWLRSAADRGDADLAPRAKRLAGLVAFLMADFSSTSYLLLDASQDETDREVQGVLAEVLWRRKDDPDRRAEARHRHELVLAGGEDDDLAARSAERLADLALEDGRDDDAVRLLAIAARTSDPAAAHAARLRRVQLLRRLGRHDEEEWAVHEMLDLLKDSEPVERRQEVQLEAAEVRRRGGDLDGAAELLRAAAAGRWKLGLRAAVELGELELSRKRWQGALEALPETLRSMWMGEPPKDLLARRDLVRGEAAFHLGQLEVAKREFRQLPKEPHAVLRLGEIALAQGHALEAYRYFLEARELATDDPGLAQRAAELGQSVQARAEQEYAQEQAVAAQQAAVVFDPDIAPA